jgi:hypothetical protein
VQAALLAEATTAALLGALPCALCLFRCCRRQVEILGQGDYVNELLLLVDGYVELFASVQTVEDKDREGL